ncbi:MAG TPA: c-type cytochrome [Chthoniobacter sp.]|jgi:putative heme-binding domain-containing protein
MSLVSPRIAFCDLALTIAVLLFLVMTDSASASPGKAKASATRSVGALVAVLEKGELREQQEAMMALGNQPGAEADRALLAQFDRYASGKLPVGLWLEFFDAVAKRKNPKLQARLTEHQEKVSSSRDPLTQYRECLEGGNAESGREIFTKKVEAGCIRCHRVNGEGGEIGPDLSAIRQVSDRLFILESIVDPNAVIAAGFQNVMLTFKNGDTAWGIANFESDDQIILTSPVDGKKHTYVTADIVDRTPLPSAMPPGFGLILGKRAIRDLIEFLATNKASAD